MPTKFILSDAPLSQESIKSLNCLPFSKTDLPQSNLDKCTLLRIVDEKIKRTINRVVESLLKQFYRKNSKNWDTSNNYHNCPTIGTVGFYTAVLCSKDANRITNREDPDQTAP